MITTEAVLHAVREADPIDMPDVHHWATSEEARLVFDRIVGSDVGVVRPFPHRRAKWIGGAAAVTVAIGSAAAASGVLGDPAPEPIRAHIAAVDEGLPDDLRLNPDVEHATAVATTAAGVLYAADVTGGGYCYEIATEGDRPRGAVCVRPDQVTARAIEVTAPIPADAAAPLLVAGRINDAAVERIVARYSNGTSEDIALGLGGYWMIEVPDAARQVALTDGLEIVGLGTDGAELAVQPVPPLADEDPTGTAHDAEQPIFVSTFSDEHDLTLVLGLEGSVNAEGATTLELQYPDGTISEIALAPDGTYQYTLPPERQSDLAAAWAQLTARDANGAVVATASFSSVANTQRGS